MTLLHARNLPGRATRQAEALVVDKSSGPGRENGISFKPSLNAPGSPVRSGPVCVLLAQPMAMVRGALVALLAAEPDIAVVAEVARSDEIVPAALQVQPDVAVIDIGIVGMDGLAIAQELQAQLPSCNTIALTGTASPHTLRKALAVNVRGFVVMDAPPGDLGETIRRVANGECVIDSTLASRALADSGNPLTPREHEVLAAAAEGESVQEIAARLSLSAGTVRNYLSAIISKLGARNRIDAVRIARSASWI